MSQNNSNWIIMKVLNRTQITQVAVIRSVSHTLELDGTVYIRSSKVTTTVPYMDQEVKVLSEKITWKKYIGSRTVQEIFKKDVKQLGLEEEFTGISKTHLNGHIVDSYYDLYNG